MINTKIIQKYNWSQRAEILAAQITDEHGLRRSRGKIASAFGSKLLQAAGR